MSTIQVYLERDSEYINTTDYCSLILKSGNLMKTFDYYEMHDYFGDCSEYAIKLMQDGDIEKLAELIERLAANNKLIAYDKWKHIEFDYISYSNFNLCSHDAKIDFVTEYEEKVIYNISNQKENKIMFDAKQELDFIINFAKDYDLEECNNGPLLQSLWIAYCLHQNINTESPEYFPTLEKIWEAQKDVYDITHEDFVAYMSESL
jgi:hypothetical protein